MLSVKTNKNINNFKSSVLGGFDIKESIAIILSTILGVGLILVLMIFTNFPKILIVYIPMPIIILPLVYTFYKKDGMTFFQHKKVESSFKKSGPMEYMSTESPERYKKYLEKVEIENKDMNDEKKFKRTVKIVSILGGIFFIAIISLIVFIIMKYK